MRQQVEIVMSEGYTIRILVQDGDPDGVRILDRMNWTGLGIVFPKSRWTKLRDEHDFETPGVYVLVATGNDPQRPTIYIGQSDDLRARIDSHARTRSNWQLGVAFLSASRGLNAAHVRWLEREMITRAKGANRCELENGNGGSEPKLPPHDLADIRAFLKNMLEIFPLIGLPIFAPHHNDGRAIAATKKSTEMKGSVIARISARGIQASAQFNLPNPSTLVLAGSQAHPDPTPTCPDGAIERQKSLVAEGILIRQGAALVFNKDFAFDSPSMAASVILGRSSNGWDQWRLPDGNPLATLRN